MFTPELRKRLSEIARGKPGACSVVESSPEYACSFEFRGVENVTEHGPFVIAECRMSEIVPETAAIVCEVCQAVSITKHDPTRLLFLDLETCGLSSVPVFLVGTMQMDGEDFVIRQFFARDYSEEKSLLCRIREVVGDADGVVTFNGKSFDVPFLRDRMVCRRYRSGDVPGSEIPAIYHEFVRSGNLEPLLPVFKHNAMDLMTMAELLPKLVGTG